MWLSVISHFSVHARVRVLYYFIFHDWCMVYWPDRGQGGCTYRTELVSSRTSTYHSAMTSSTPVPWQLGYRRLKFVNNIQWTRTSILGNVHPTAGCALVKKLSVVGCETSIETSRITQLTITFLINLFHHQQL